MDGPGLKEEEEELNKILKNLSKFGLAKIQISYETQQNHGFSIFSYFSFISSNF